MQWYAEFERWSARLAFVGVGGTSQSSSSAQGSDEEYPIPARSSILFFFRVLGRDDGVEVLEAGTFSDESTGVDGSIAFSFLGYEAVLQALLACVQRTSKQYRTSGLARSIASAYPGMSHPKPCTLYCLNCCVP
jgi:hypothetical protein